MHRSGCTHSQNIFYLQKSKLSQIAEFATKNMQQVPIPCMGRLTARITHEQNIDLQLWSDNYLEALKAELIPIWVAKSWWLQFDAFA